MRLNLLALLIGLRFPAFNTTRVRSPGVFFELENGLDVILIPCPSSRKNALLVLFDAGNRNDRRVKAEWRSRPNTCG